MPRITLWGFYQYDKTLFDGVVLPSGMDKEILVSDIMRSSGDLYPYHQVPEFLKHNITYWFSRRLFDFDRMYQALRAEYSPIENYDRKENITRQYENSGIDKATTTLGSTTTSKHTGEDDEITTLGSSMTSKHTGEDDEITTLGSTTTSKHTGEDDEITTLGSSTTSVHTGTDTKENQVSAYNESNYTNRDKESQTYNTTTSNTGSGSDTKKQSYDSTVTNTGSGSDTKKQSYDSTVTNTGSGSDMTQTEYGLKRNELEETRVHGNIGITTSQMMVESEVRLRMEYDIYRIITREFEKEFLIQIY